MSPLRGSLVHQYPQRRQCNNTPVRTRATPAAPATQTITTTTHDEDEVDYGDGVDLTDVSELEHQLTGTATSGQPTNTHVPVTPEPAPARFQTPAGENTVVTVPMAFLNKMTNTMSALTTHLSTLQPQALSAQAQLALGATPPPPPPENPRVQSIRNHWAVVDPVQLQEILEH
ncbi:hypothetical protein FN846DRAFT_911838 [Sphaerosporella brunnea]|uniref:Uncharacterized protein n=1 Tax=Sphaerosporella brunnea TaxID=1250544 RepID=A0A5J5EJZ0_9PEZI|nr:hypothetical protein FN846DRAFT_911838 [Sphaerosporella brunnea]